MVMAHRKRKRCAMLPWSSGSQASSRFSPAAVVEFQKSGKAAHRRDLYRRQSPQRYPHRGPVRPGGARGASHPCHRLWPDSPDLCGLLPISGIINGLFVVRPRKRPVLGLEIWSPSTSIPFQVGHWTAIQSESIQIAFERADNSLLGGQLT